MTAQLSPLARQNAFNLGHSVPGALLYAWAAGGVSSARTTYYNAALTVANTNPLQADANGLFGPIFLSPGVGYLFELRTPEGVLIWQQDNVFAPLSSDAIGAVDNGICEFRLTAAAQVPVPSTDVTASTAIFLSPYSGNRIVLYDSFGTPTVLESQEVTVAVPSTTSKLYDVFAYNNSGVVVLELVAWTNDSTRAVALGRLYGAYTKVADLTRRYMGSFRTTGVSGQTEDSAVKRYVWNYYNRVPRRLFQNEATASWVYDSATVRQANGSTANQVDVVLGVAEVPVSLTATSMWRNATAALFATIGIGVDSITTIDTAVSHGGGMGSDAGGNYIPAICQGVFEVAAGRHYFAQLEVANTTGTNTFYGAGPAAFSRQTGISGSIDG